MPTHIHYSINNVIFNDIALRRWVYYFEVGGLHMVYTRSNGINCSQWLTPLKWAKVVGVKWMVEGEGWWCMTEALAAIVMAVVLVPV